MITLFKFLTILKKNVDKKVQNITKYKPNKSILNIQWS